MKFCIMKLRCTCNYTNQGTDTKERQLLEKLLCQSTNFFLLVKFSWGNTDLTTAGAKNTIFGIRAIPWLLMAWLNMLPGHHQLWYWQWGINRTMYPMGHNFITLCHLNIEKWHKICEDIFFISKDQFCTTVVNNVKWNIWHLMYMILYATTNQPGWYLLVKYLCQLYNIQFDIKISEYVKSNTTNTQFQRVLYVDKLGRNVYTYEIYSTRSTKNVLHFVDQYILIWEHNRGMYHS